MTIGLVEFLNRNLSISLLWCGGSNMALPKKNRLSDKSGIEKVFKKGKRLDSELFSIKFLPALSPMGRAHSGAGNNSSQFAIVVGLKISKKAVLRNKIRRMISEIIRLNISKLKPGYKIVLMAKPAVLNKEAEDLEKFLMKELGRIDQ